jgi:hypothetical protein
MALLGTAFALGLIVGGASLAMAARAGNASWIWRGRSASRTGAGYGVRIDRNLKLGLDAARRDSITAIWEHQRRDVDSLQRSIAPQVDSLFQIIRPAIETRRTETRNAIRALLTQPQQVKYDSMNAADDAQRRKMHDQAVRGGSPGIGSPGGPGPRGGFDRGPH